MVNVCCNRVFRPSGNGCIHGKCELPVSVLVKDGVFCDVVRVLLCGVNMATDAFGVFGTVAVTDFS